MSSDVGCTRKKDPVFRKAYVHQFVPQGQLLWSCGADTNFVIRIQDNSRYFRRRLALRFHNPRSLPFHQAEMISTELRSTRTGPWHCPVFLPCFSGKLCLLQLSTACIGGLPEFSVPRPQCLQSIDYCIFFSLPLSFFLPFISISISFRISF